MAAFLFAGLVPGCSKIDRSSGVRPLSDKPNIIIILADDLGYSDTSAYEGWVQTPNLERMAAEGLRFTDFHSNGAVCSPTRAGLMTGRYQQRVGIEDVIVGTREKPTIWLRNSQRGPRPCGQPARNGAGTCTKAICRISVSFPSTAASPPGQGAIARVIPSSIRNLVFQLTDRL